MEILKTKGSIKLIKINDTKYEIRDGNELMLSMEGNYTEEKLQEQFDGVSKHCIII